VEQQLQRTPDRVVVLDQQDLRPVVRVGFDLIFHAVAVPQPGKRRLTQ